MKLFPSFLAGLLALACSAALAQWQWLDSEGRKVFSDRAPPPDIAEKNILKRPGARVPPPAASEQAGSAGSAQASTAANAPAGVDKELEAKKKQLADEQAAKRKAEEERFSKSKAENCAHAKQAKATLDSGVRMARVNGAGQREIMDDAARDAEFKRIQGIIESDCK